MDRNETHSIEIPYQKVGNYYLPMFSYPTADRSIGYWGMLRRDYLKEYHPAYFAQLI